MNYANKQTNKKTQRLNKIKFISKLYKVQYKCLCDSPLNSDSESHLKRNWTSVYARTVGGVYHFCLHCTGQNPNMQTQLAEGKTGRYH